MQQIPNFITPVFWDDQKCLPVMDTIFNLPTTLNVESRDEK